MLTWQFSPIRQKEVLRFSFPCDMVEAQKFLHSSAIPQSQKTAKLGAYRSSCVRHLADIEHISYCRDDLKTQTKLWKDLYNASSMPRDHRTEQILPYPLFPVSIPPPHHTPHPTHLPQLGWFWSEPSQKQRVGPKDLLRFLSAFWLSKCIELFTLLYTTTTFFSHVFDLAIYTISFALQFLKRKARTRASLF